MHAPYQQATSYLFVSSLLSPLLFLFRGSSLHFFRPLVSPFLLLFRVLVSPFLFPFRALSSFLSLFRVLVSCCLHFVCCSRLSCPCFVRWSRLCCFNYVCCSRLCAALAFPVIASSGLAFADFSVPFASLVFPFFFSVLLVLDSLRSVCIDVCFALVFGSWFEVSFKKMPSTQTVRFGAGPIGASNTMRGAKKWYLWKVERFAVFCPYLDDSFFPLHFCFWILIN